MRRLRFSGDQQRTSLADEFDRSPASPWPSRLRWLASAAASEMKDQRVSGTFGRGQECELTVPADRWDQKRLPPTRYRRMIIEVGRLRP